MNITWWIIGVLIILLIVGIFKMQDLIYIFSFIRKYSFIFLSVGFILFLCFSMYRIAAAYDIDFTSFEGLIRGGKLYFAWLKSLFGNLGNITGYAIRQDWVLNSTNVTA